MQEEKECGSFTFSWVVLEILVVFYYLLVRDFSNCCMKQRIEQCSPRVGEQGKGRDVQLA